MAQSKLYAAIRFGFGAMTLVAVSIQLGIHISHGYSVLNFFSYFTNLSNIFAAIVLLVDAVLTFRGKELGTFGNVLRCASVVCMTLVGVVFSVLLRDVDLGSLLPWINTRLHYIMPIMVLLDWIIKAPSQCIPFRAMWFMVALPIVYLAYSLIRGALINWYAYPFLNPANGGYGAVAVTCVAIAIGFVAVTALIIWLGNTLAARGFALTAKAS